MAEYGISRMKEKTQYYEFYLAGVLTTLKGALDYILEEYNQKYGLGIGLDEVLAARSFRKRAKQLGNAAALAFIDAYDEEKKRLLSERKVAVLLGSQGLRDVYVHRTQVSKDVSVNAFATVSAVASFEVRDAAGNLVTKLPPPPSPPSPRPAEVRYYLRDWKEDDVDSLCEYSLAKVREFVGLMRKKFPLPAHGIRSSSRTKPQEP